MAGLRAALDSGYQMRGSTPAPLIGATNQSILVQRERVQRSISALEIATT